MMRIRGASLEDLERATASVSPDYGLNIIVHPDARDLPGKRSIGCQARLYVNDSRGPGARRSWSGRRQRATCWHACRDVLRALFAIRPDAVVMTAMARYEGVNGFEKTYPVTASRNVGSMVQPVYMDELCDCHEHGRL